MKFPQDDQIVLLKGGKQNPPVQYSSAIYWHFCLLTPGVFELAVIRMSRYYDISQKAVLFLDCMLPKEAFMTTQDTVEMSLVTKIFDFAQSLAEMQLSEEALALYSAYILLQESEFKT